MPNYFYGPQAEQFSFYRLPKVLFTDPLFRSISAEAKILYGLLLDRMSLSAQADGVAAGMECEGKDNRVLYQDYFSRQLNVDSLIAANPDDEDMLREMLELLVDTVCSRRKLIRIAGDDKPAEVVKSQLMKLDSDHIRFVLGCMKENTTQVRNMRQYLLAALYNAPLTMYNYYASRVQHDLNPKPAKY